jgi:hypothetical protein
MSKNNTLTYSAQASRRRALLRSSEVGLYFIEFGSEYNRFGGEIVPWLEEVMCGDAQAQPRWGKWVRERLETREIRVKNRFFEKINKVYFATVF